MLFCPHDKKGERVSRARGEDGRVVRKCKKCGHLFDSARVSEKAVPMARMREKYYSGWKNSVERSKNWIEEKD